MDNVIRAAGAKLFKEDLFKEDFFKEDLFKEVAQQPTSKRKIERFYSLDYEMDLAVSVELYERCLTGDIGDLVNHPGFCESEWNHCMKIAAQHGYVSLINLMLQKGANCIKDALLTACVAGHIEAAHVLVNKLSWNQVNWSTLLTYACQDENDRLVNCLIEILKEHNHFVNWDAVAYRLGPNTTVATFEARIAQIPEFQVNYKHLADMAIGALNREIFKYAYSRLGHNYLFHESYKFGSLEIYRMMPGYEKHTSELITAMCKNGNLDELKIVFGDPNLKPAFIKFDAFNAACINGRLDILDFLLTRVDRKGAATITSCLEQACARRHEKLIDYLISYALLNAIQVQWYVVFYSACKSGSRHIIAKILPHVGDDDDTYLRAITVICRHGYFDLVDSIMALTPNWQNHVDRYMAAACTHGNLVLIKKFLPYVHYRPQYDDQQHVIIYLLDLDHSTPNEILPHALVNRNMYLTRLMLERGASNLSQLTSIDIYALIEDGMPLAWFESRLDLLNVNTRNKVEKLIYTKGAQFEALCEFAGFPDVIANEILQILRLY